jgi:hypothetical protein
MGFLGKFVVQKPAPVIDFPEDRPLHEIEIPGLPDGSAFALQTSKEALDGSDEKNHWKGGGLDHVYRSRFGFNKEICPLCYNETKQKYVALIYASDFGIRQSFSPCAWICESCSCVVLDEMIPAQSARWKGYSYFVPVGIASANTFFESRKDDMNIFTTYEGKKPVFVVDQDSKDVTDVMYENEINSSTCFAALDSGNSQKKQLSEEKKRQKRKAEKQARKKQRH